MITGNRTAGMINGSNGGGMYCYKAFTVITSCIISRNVAYDGEWGSARGGGIYLTDSSPIVTNCTISKNTTSDEGGGIYSDGLSSPIITNCVHWGNSPSRFYVSETTGNDPLVTYCNIERGYSGEANIDANPLFADPENGNFNLQPDSPCIDVGSNDAPELPDTDFEGNARVVDGDIDGTATVDMEAYEYGPTIEFLTVPVDIKPGSCPNPFRLPQYVRDVRGKLPVAILGTGDLDVMTIDPATIKIKRECDGCEPVAPLRWANEDVASPFEGELCECHDLNGDGYTDLTLKFKRKQLARRLNLYDAAGETIPLTVIGNLKEEFGGTPIEAEDCVRIKMRKQTADVTLDHACAIDGTGRLGCTRAFPVGYDMRHRIDYTLIGDGSEQYEVIGTVKVKFNKGCKYSSQTTQMVGPGSYMMVLDKHTVPPCSEVPAYKTIKYKLTVKKDSQVIDVETATWEIRVWRFGG
jgi:hypothetical protein